MPTGHRLTSEQIQYICSNYANKTNYELCDETGLSRSTICRVQSRHGLRKSNQHIHDMGVKAGTASNIARGGIIANANTPEVIARRAETYKKTYRTEEMRYLWGLEPRTRIRIKKVCRRAHDQRLNLIKRGYIIDDVSKIAYWTEETHRSTRLESIPRGQMKGCFKSFYDFKPITEKENNE